MDQLLLRAHQIEIEKLEKKIAQMQRLATRQGFFQHYFELCKDCPTNLEAFERTNDLYFELYGEYRYSSYNSFRILKNQFLNTKS